MWFCRCFSLYWTAVASKVKKKKVGHWKDKREGGPETHSLFRMTEVPGAARMALTMSWEGASRVVGGLLPWVVLLPCLVLLFSQISYQKDHVDGPLLLALPTARRQPPRQQFPAQLQRSRARQRLWYVESLVPTPSVFKPVKSDQQPRCISRCGEVDILLVCCVTGQRSTEWIPVQAGMLG